MKNSAKKLSLFLSAVMLFSAFTVNAALGSNLTPAADKAAILLDEPISGICGKEGGNLTWTLSGGVLTISGIGEMADYLYGDAPWYSYKDSVEMAVIEDNITNIGAGAFYDCAGLTSITIPESVASIGDDAFSCCTGLTGITIPENVLSIGDYAFFGCTGLTGIIIPENITSIGESAFSYCAGLKSITIPDSLTSVADYAFYYCDGLTGVTIPDSITSIGDYAFYNCAGLTDITIPKNAAYIGICAFSYCTGLTSITIPDSSIYIGDCAFYSCAGLTEAAILSETAEFGGTYIFKYSSYDLVIKGSSGSSAEIYAGQNNCNFSVLEDKPAYTPAPPKPIISVETDVPVCEAYAQKINVKFRTDTDGKAALNIEAKTSGGYEKIQATAYIAYFDERGVFTGVEILKTDENGNYSFDIKNGNYRIILWDNMKPIINAIKQSN